MCARIFTHTFARYRALRAFNTRRKRFLTQAQTRACRRRRRDVSGGDDGGGGGRIWVKQTTVSSLKRSEKATTAAIAPDKVAFEQNHSFARMLKRTRYSL